MRTSDSFVDWWRTRWWKQILINGDFSTPPLILCTRFCTRHSPTFLVKSSYFEHILLRKSGFHQNYQKKSGGWKNVYKNDLLRGASAPKNVCIFYENQWNLAKSGFSSSRKTLEKHFLELTTKLRIHLSKCLVSSLARRVFGVWNISPSRNWFGEWWFLVDILCKKSSFHPCPS